MPGIDGVDHRRDHGPSRSQRDPARGRAHHLRRRRARPAGDHRRGGRLPGQGHAPGRDHQRGPRGRAPARACCPPAVTPAAPGTGDTTPAPRRTSPRPAGDAHPPGARGGPGRDRRCDQRRDRPPLHLSVATVKATSRASSTSSSSTTASRSPCSCRLRASSTHVGWIQSVRPWLSSFWRG